ncbi:MAG: flagellar filament capping protein FliD [Chakrabartia sp.]
MSQPLVSTTQGPRTLADIGVQTNRDGSVTLDSKRLDTALKAAPDAVAALFSPLRDATHSDTTDPGISGAVQALRTSLLSANGPVDILKARLQKTLDALGVQRTKVESDATAYKDRLTRTFSGMDTRVAALKATQSYLEQQIAQWNK